MRTAIDTVWDKLVFIDPEEQLHMRYKQLAYLGRYGKQNVTQWQDVEVLEMDRHFQALADLVGDENEAALRAQRQSR